MISLKRNGEGSKRYICGAGVVDERISTRKKSSKTLSATMPPRGQQDKDIC